MRTKIVITAMLVVVVVCAFAYGINRDDREPKYMKERRWKLADDRKERKIEKRTAKREAVLNRANAIKARKAAKRLISKEDALLKRIKELEKQIELLIKRMDALERKCK